MPCDARALVQSLNQSLQFQNGPDYLRSWWRFGREGRDRGGGDVEKRQTPIGSRCSYHRETIYTNHLAFVPVTSKNKKQKRKKVDFSGPFLGS